MNFKKSFFYYMNAAVSAAFILAGCSISEERPSNDPYNMLWYDSPASIWEETLPLGNGRLGMMPDGGIGKESIVLNDISMWSGSEADYSNPDAGKTIPAIRQLLFDGKNREAQELLYKSFLPKKSPGTFGSFQILGNLCIDFGHDCSKTSNYKRWLDLSDAVAHTEYDYEGIHFEREYFVSRNEDVMLVHLSSNVMDALNFTASLSRPEKFKTSCEGSTLLMQGTLDSGVEGLDGIHYVAAMRVLSEDGNLELTDSTLSLKRGKDAWIVISATTSYTTEGTDFPGNGYYAKCMDLLDKACINLRKSDKQVIDNHIKAHQQFYNRVKLNLQAGKEDYLPTDRRLTAFEQTPSPAMAALYYNYGRYLFISSTREGSLPPNLQGLWANTIDTPWQGDYHININLQMNYWPMEQAGLGELIMPLTAMIERTVDSARKTAKAFYGDNAQGWVMHMQTNAWKYSAPGEHPQWGATNTGGAWLCAHLWDHYAFTLDKEYLQRVYPIMKGAAEFFRSTCMTAPEGHLVTGPTSSPENEFYMPGDKTPVSICMGPTMDVQLLTELYTNVASAADILGCDREFAEQLRADITKFPPMQISSKGYLQEWLADYEEVDPHHRHVSHLYGLHPGHQISAEQTPELLEACRQTLQRRGDGGTGWSRAWKVNFWARLGDGDRAWTLLQRLLHPAVNPENGRHESGTFPNLFCSHEPYQIDGNFGGAAGIGEMLLQSNGTTIKLLPALPSDWSEGEFEGFRTRGGAEVSLKWSNGIPVKCTIKSHTGGNYTIIHPDGTSQLLSIKPGQSTTL